MKKNIVFSSKHPVSKKLIFTRVALRYERKVR